MNPPLMIFASRKAGIATVAVISIAGVALLMKRPKESGNPVDSNSGDKAVDGASTKRSNKPNTFHYATADEIKAIKSTSLEDFNRYWQATLKTAGNESDKVTGLAGLATSMAMAGYEDEALAKTRDALGAGELRCKVIAQIFMHCSTLEKGSLIFNELTNPDEKVAACRGLAQTLAMRSSLSQVDLQDYAFLGASRDTLLSSLAERYVTQHFQGTDDEKTEAFNEAFQLDLSHDGEVYALRSLNTMVPFDCWNYIAGKGLGAYPEEGKDIVFQMVGNDPARAVSQIIAAPGGDGLLVPAVTQWLAKDQQAPLTWLEENSGKLTTAQKDQIYSGISTFAAQRGDLTLAKQWAESIFEADIRTKVEKLINPKDEQPH